MEEKILKTIKEYRLIESGDKIIVAVSGGPDSMCLLHILEKIRKEQNLIFSICVAHVNHGIREEAEEETEYVKSYCEAHEIECYIKKVKVKEIAHKEKIGLEEAGRKIRYEFFEEVLKKTDANKIATAHQLNDKVETILMNMIRGCGPLGLKGIEPKREDKYIRPLLEVTRAEIEEYCKKYSLAPKMDASNQDNEFTRNKIRNILIPYLEKEFNPSILKAVDQLSKITVEEQNYLNKIVYTIYQQVMLEEKDEKIILDLKKFNQQDIVIKKRLILYTINKLFGTTQNIEKIHIEDIIKLCERNIGNKYLTPNKKTKIFVRKGKICVMRINEYP